MLRGRDIFHSFFARSPLLPECPPESVEFEDPSQWVNSLRLQCGEYHLLESSIALVSWGTCDILEPTADTVEPVGQLSLLSHRQLQSIPLEWPRDSTVGRVQSPISGYIHWARYVLQAHRGTLQTAGIYEDVYASLFNYGRLPSSWARGLVEFWDAGRDEQLFQRVPSADGDRRGRLVLPDVYPVALQHYRQTYRASDVSRRARASMPMEVWVRSFLQEGYLSTVGVSQHDPFGLDLQRGIVLSEETAEPTFTVDRTSPGLPGVTEDLLLVGFLAVWLCTFVFPLRAGSVRCSILLPVSQLAQGHRLALAPATLSWIYKSLRIASEATSLELRDMILPWQYLYGWIHLHVQGTFYVLESPAYFSEITDRFTLAHQTATVSLPPHQRGTVVVDGTDRRGRRTLLLCRQSLAVAEYFISMRPGWLCYRSGNTVTLEGYQPNRVARQFGYSQATAFDGRPVAPGVTDVLHMETVPQETRFFTAALTWLHLLRLGIGSSFLLAQPSSSTGVSFTWLTWVRLSFGPALEQGARRYKPRVRGLGSSRGWRPHRGSSVVTFERGTDTEAHTTAGATVLSSPRATALEGFEYATEISYHVPLLPDSRSADRCSHTGALLKDLIFSIDPRSPASWIEFVPTTDRLLGLLAIFGVSTTELVFWESLCRAVKYHIRRLRDLSVLRTRVTLPELEERVTRRREEADDTHDRFDSSAVALRRHRESSSRMDTEVSELTTRVRSLWRDIKEVMSKKIDVEERHGRRDRLTSREEQRYLALQ
ncbi:hypothetical protein M5K25_024339 [Dendrobium thyrsiflorum]|uniref:Aminotransferase-like plant mobile domain-containing protein n=1 Tax=Dendrobium thyrsiflorum TaxID=117978 RepID=A0ABD0U1P3_DENTH